MRFKRSILANALCVLSTAVLTTAGAAWYDRDLTCKISGGSMESGGSITVKGSGSDIWGRSDHFHFTYKVMAGDGEIVARVVSQTQTNSWAKAGVMFRDIIRNDSKNAFMCVTPKNGVVMQTRVELDQDSRQIPGTRAAAPYWVKLNRSGATFSGYHSADGSNWVLTGSQIITMSDTILVGLAVTSHNDTALSTVVFDNVVIAGGVLNEVPPQGNFPLVEHCDIGNVGIPGSFNLLNGTYYVQGSGADIFGTRDAFHFVYTRLVRDGMVIARVDSVENTDGWAKAGVMIRNSLLPSSQHAMMAITPGGVGAFQIRCACNTQMACYRDYLPTVKGSWWVKLVRAGNTLTGYVSAEGVKWNQDGSPQTIIMADTVYAGLCVTAHNNTKLNTSMFSNLFVAPFGTPLKVSPVLENVDKNCDGSYTAHFGYYNPNAWTVVIPVGANNRFVYDGVDDKGQPTSFAPGRQRNIFTVPFNGQNLVWSLNGKTTTASSNGSVDVCH